MTSYNIRNPTFSSILLKSCLSYTMAMRGIVKSMFCPPKASLLLVSAADISVRDTQS